MNTFKKIAAFAMSALMLVSASGCDGATSSTVEIKAETKEDVKKLVDQFYDGLAEANPVEMTSMMDGKETSVFTRSGTNMKVEDKANNITFYLFEENGKKYYLDEGGQPTEQDYTYDFYNETINMNLTMLVTGYFQDGVGEEDGIKYSAHQTETTADGKTEAELELVISAEQDGETVEIKTTGSKTDDKVTKVVCTMTGKDQTQTFEHSFKYDNLAINLPEYTIYDRSQFYHHVDSPYETFKQAQDDAGEDGLPYLTFGSKVYVVTVKDGKYYQLSAELDSETAAAYEALDFEAEDYTEKVNAMFDPLTITDCVDFSELALSAEDIENYKGKKLSVLMEEGFEQNGYSVWDEGANVYMAKNDIVYEIDITLPEGFDTEADFEFEDLADAVINSIVFNDVNGSAFPME